MANANGTAAQVRQLVAELKAVNFQLDNRVQSLPSEAAVEESIKSGELSPDFAAEAIYLLRSVRSRLRLITADVEHAAGFLKGAKSDEK